MSAVWLGVFHAEGCWKKIHSFQPSRTPHLPSLLVIFWIKKRNRLVIFISTHANSNLSFTPSLNQSIGLWYATQAKPVGDFWFPKASCGFWINIWILSNHIWIVSWNEWIASNHIYLIFCCIWCLGIQALEGMWVGRKSRGFFGGTQKNGHYGTDKSEMEVLVLGCFFPPFFEGGSGWESPVSGCIWWDIGPKSWASDFYGARSEWCTVRFYTTLELEQIEILQIEFVGYSSCSRMVNIHYCMSICGIYIYLYAIYRSMFDGGLGLLQGESNIFWEPKGEVWGVFF